MKAKDLSDLLLHYPNFEVSFALIEADDSVYGIRMRSFEVTGIADIGHSDKSLQLDFKET